MTYSIVARDPETGEVGVAVQSHWFSVGPIVPWAEAGVGGVATQAFVEPAHGPGGLERLRAGRTAQEALEELLSADEQAAHRQVAIVDARGGVAAHTGEMCIREAGHVLGDGFSAQANMMAGGTVWGAMARAFEEADGDLAARLVGALEAAEGEGGDVRGRQSAAILVVRAEGTDRPWIDRSVDLRVEDHPDPVAELRRLLGLRRAYDRMNEGDELSVLGDLTAALARYAEAEALAPGSPEPVFWHGVMLASAGRVEEAREVLRDVLAVPRWAELLRRLPEVDLLPQDALRALLEER